MRKMSNPIESAIRIVNALSILSESAFFVTKEKKAIAKLSRINKRFDTIAILNTVIYSRVIL